MSNGPNYSQEQFETLLCDLGLTMSEDGKRVVKGAGVVIKAPVFTRDAAQAGAMQRARKQPIEIDGYKFPTAAEAKRYRVLSKLQQGGYLRGLEVHPWWQITVKGIDICRVVADFSYEERCQRPVSYRWEKVVEDVKAERRDKVTGKLKFTTDTGRSKLGRKLVLACYGVEIKVIK